MPLAPLSKFAAVLGGQTAQDFSDRHATEDVVLIEPFEKGRQYGGSLHPQASYMFVPKAPGQPVPVGRDERAVVQIDHAAVSRLHLVLAWSGRTWQAMDRSSNGCWAAGDRLPQEQAVDLAYGVPVRLGRAVVLRVSTPAELYNMITDAPQTRTFLRTEPQPAPPPPPPSHSPADPGSSTWRFPKPTPPAVGGSAFTPAPPPRPAAPPSSDDVEIEFDLDFDDDRGGFA